MLASLLNFCLERKVSSWDYSNNHRQAHVSVLMKNSFTDLTNLDFKEIVIDICSIFPDLFDTKLHVILQVDKRGCPNAETSISPKLSIIYAILM